MKVVPLHPVSRTERANASPPRDAEGFGDALSLALLGVANPPTGASGDPSTGPSEVGSPAVSDEPSIGRSDDAATGSSDDRASGELHGETRDAADRRDAAWLPDPAGGSASSSPKIPTGSYKTGRADPRGVSVEGNGASAPDLPTLTTREPGSDARGLRWGAVQPGGARIDSSALPLGRQSGSRGVPPPDTQVEGARRASEAAPGRPERPTDAQAHMRTSMRMPDTARAAGARTDATGRSTPDPPGAATPATPEAAPAGATASADGRALDRALSPAELARAEATETVEAEAIPEEFLDGPTPPTGAHDADPVLAEVDPAMADADGAPEPAPRQARPTPTPATAEARPRPTPAEPPLPPGRTHDGAVRIHLDPNVAVEVSAEGDAVDVTLEGRAEHTADLEDAGAELEEALDEGGFDLHHFRRRDRRQAPATSLHRGRGADAQPSDPDEGPRRIRRGTLLDILA